MLWNAHEEQRHASEVHHAMINRDGRLNRIATDVGQGIGDLSDGLCIDAAWLAVIRNAKHETHAVGVICRRNQMFGKALLAPERLTFSAE
jgi:hypothetical protein